MLENTEKSSSEKLKIKAIEIAQLLNGLTIYEAKSILAFISQSIENNTIVHFDSNLTA